MPSAAKCPPGSSDRPRNTRDIQLGTRCWCCMGCSLRGSVWSATAEHTRQQLSVLRTQGRPVPARSNAGSTTQQATSIIEAKPAATVVYGVSAAPSRAGPGTQTWWRWDRTMRRPLPQCTARQSRAALPHDASYPAAASVAWYAWSLQAGRVCWPSDNRDHSRPLLRDHNPWVWSRIDARTCCSAQRAGKSGGTRNSRAQNATTMSTAADEGRPPEESNKAPASQSWLQWLLRRHVPQQSHTGERSPHPGTDAPEPTHDIVLLDGRSLESDLGPTCAHLVALARRCAPLMLTRAAVRTSFDCWIAPLRHRSAIQFKR